MKQQLQTFAPTRKFLNTSNTRTKLFYSSPKNAKSVQKIQHCGQHVANQTTSRCPSCRSYWLMYAMRHCLNLWHCDVDTPTHSLPLSTTSYDSDPINQLIKSTNQKKLPSVSPKIYDKKSRGTSEKKQIF